MKLLSLAGRGLLPLASAYPAQPVLSHSALSPACGGPRLLSVSQTKCAFLLPSHPHTHSALLGSLTLLALRVSAHVASHPKGVSDRPPA